MFTYITLGTDDLARAARFYDAVLGALGQVRDFHAAALAHGGRSEGEPGLRPHYNPDFYAAYVRDPDGNKLAAVCRGFTSEPLAGG